MNLIERQFDTKIKYFFTDNGTEYVNSNVRHFFHEKGIVHNTIPAYTHEYNGMAERFNRTISTMVRMLLLHGNLHGHLQEEKQLDKRLWAEASRTAVYIKNRLPHSALPNNITPFEALMGEKPEVAHMKPFGATCYIHIPKEKRASGTKLEPRAEKAIFLGYSTSHKIYRIQLQSTRHILEVPAAECKFVPFHAPLQEEESLFIEASNEPLIEPSNEPLIEPSISMSNAALVAAAMLDADDLPNTYDEAMTSPESQLWLAAIKDELSSMEQQDVWTIVPRMRRRTVGCRWVFVKKRNEYGEITRYKARLVAKGFTEHPGVDFDEIYAPVVRYDSLRLLLALATKNGWIPTEIDIKAAFLYGELKEEIYMELPPGYGNQKGELPPGYDNQKGEIPPEYGNQRGDEVC